MAKNPTYETLQKKVQDLEKKVADFKVTEETLKASEKRFRQAVENTPNPIFTVDKKGLIATWNLSCERVFKHGKDIIGHDFGVLFKSAAQRSQVATMLGEIFKKGALNDLELAYLCKDGSERFTISRLYPVYNLGGGVERCIFANTDITGRKQTEKDLQQSEERFRQLSEASFESIVIHKEGVVLRANDQYFKMFGYEPHELLGKQVLSLTVAQESVAFVKEQIASESKETYEFVGLRKDGSKFSVESRIRTMDYEGQKARVAVMRDVTAQRQFERQLVGHRERLRSLASELSLAEERQRRRIAAEVHDHIGQNLAFAKMKLTDLRKRASSQSLVLIVNELTGFIDQSIQDVRNLVAEFAFPVLYELGFAPAVQWLVQRTAKRHSIAIDFEDDNTSKPMDEDLQVLLFQSVRELLANMVKHSHAQTGKVSISETPATINVVVRDTGIGFDTHNMATAISNNGSFGLFSIEERLEPFGGTMAVESKPGAGTSITLVAPLKKNILAKTPTRNTGSAM